MNVSDITLSLVMLPKIATLFSHYMGLVIFFQQLPRAGSGVARTDLLSFLATCKRRLNQALSVLSVSVGFFLCILLFITASFC